MQKIGIVSEEPEPVVASLAQQPADRPSGMIMIKMLWPWITADRAPVSLRQAHLRDVVLGQLVSTVEIGGTALGVPASLAATTEA
jgi:hypothetical protein